MSDTGTAAAPVILSADPGFAALDDETKGYFQNRGLDKKPLFEGLIEAAKAHREAEKHIGAPANELLRLPKDPNSPDWDKVWQRLGAPADAKDYDFSGVKFADGSDLDQAFVDTMRSAIAKAGTPKDKAPEIARAVVQFMDNQDKADLADRTAKLATEREALKVNWGQNIEANMFLAKQGALKAGIGADQVQAMENQLGYAKTMEVFRMLGEALGEGRFVQGGTGNNPGLMTREQATARIAELKTDTAWGTRYMNGDREAAREFDALTRIIAQRAA